MPTEGRSFFTESNGIRLHYLTYGQEETPLLLIHGLTANARTFEGLVAAGLSRNYGVIVPDLRGRGLSDSPESGYSLAEHARDIVGLLDALKIEKIRIGGHSFGALLTLYLAYHYPERVEKIILIDGAARMHPNVKEMLGPALSRLGRLFPSFDAYLEEVKRAPQMAFWDETMRGYYQAEVKENEDGSIGTRSSVAQITESAYKVLEEPWEAYLRAIRIPALLLNATGIYTFGAPLLPKAQALETVSLLHDCRYVEVEGNHHTMLYGNGARQIVEAVKGFLN